MDNPTQRKTPDKYERLWSEIKDEVDRISKTVHEKRTESSQLNKPDPEFEPEPGKDVPVDSPEPLDLPDPEEVDLLSSLLHDVSKKVDELSSLFPASDASDTEKSDTREGKKPARV